MILSNSTAGESCGWREYVDLEHTICYNNSNHWNALTDGRVKYIFNAMDASEQLFNLTADPGELNDLSALPQFLVWNLAHTALHHHSRNDDSPYWSCGAAAWWLSLNLRIAGQSSWSTGHCKHEHRASSTVRTSPLRRHTPERRSCLMTVRCVSLVVSA